MELQKKIASARNATAARAVCRGTPCVTVVICRAPAAERSERLGFPGWTGSVADATCDDRGPRDWLALAASCATPGHQPISS
jgi:hypothetical protein